MTCERTKESEIQLKATSVVDMESPASESIISESSIEVAEEGKAISTLEDDTNHIHESEQAKANSHRRDGGILPNPELDYSLSVPSDYFEYDELSSVAGGSLENLERLWAAYCSKILKPNKGSRTLGEKFSLDGHPLQIKSTLKIASFSDEINTRESSQEDSHFHSRRSGEFSSQHKIQRNGNRHSKVDIPGGELPCYIQIMLIGSAVVFLLAAWTFLTASILLFQHKESQEEPKTETSAMGWIRSSDDDGYRYLTENGASQ